MFSKRAENAIFKSIWAAYNRGADIDDIIRLAKLAKTRRDKAMAQIDEDKNRKEQDW